MKLFRIIKWTYLCRFKGEHVFRVVMLYDRPYRVCQHCGAVKF